MVATTQSQAKKIDLAPGIVKWGKSGEEPSYDIDSSKIQKMELTNKVMDEGKILLDYILSLTNKLVEDSDTVYETEEITEAAIWEAAQYVGLQHYTSEHKYEILRIRLSYSLAEYLAHREGTMQR